MQIISESFLSENVTDEQIQEATKDLSLMLGQLLKTKIELQHIIDFLE